MEKFEKFERKLKTFWGFMNEPKTHFFENGGVVTEFAIPLKKNKDDEPVWLNCKCSGELAEKIGEYPKNTAVTVMGYFKNEKGKDGKDYLKFVVLLAQ